MLTNKFEKTYEAIIFQDKEQETTHASLGKEMESTQQIINIADKFFSDEQLKGHVFDLSPNQEAIYYGLINRFLGEIREAKCKYICKSYAKAFYKMLKDLKVCENIEQFKEILNPEYAEYKIIICKDTGVGTKPPSIFNDYYKKQLEKFMKSTYYRNINKKIEEADISDFDN